MEISGANAIILHMVEKEQCTVKRILSHRQHTDGSVAPTRGYCTVCTTVPIGTGTYGRNVHRTGMHVGYVLAGIRSTHIHTTRTYI